MVNKNLEEQGEELFNGKALEDITLDDVEEFKEAYYEGDPKITDEEYDEIIQNGIYSPQQKTKSILESFTLSTIFLVFSISS